MVFGTVEFGWLKVAAQTRFFKRSLPTLESVVVRLVGVLPLPFHISDARDTAEFSGEVMQVPEEFRFGDSGRSCTTVRMTVGIGCFHCGWCYAPPGERSPTDPNRAAAN